MLTQQPCCSAVVSRHCEVVWHSLRALICRPQLALSQSGSRQVLWVCVVSCMGCAGQVRKKKLGSKKTPPSYVHAFISINRDQHVHYHDTAFLFMQLIHINIDEFSRAMHAKRPAHLSLCGCSS